MMEATSEFFPLPLGPQEVKAEKKGFKSVVRTGINLEVGQEAVVNLRLEVGEFVQQVVIHEEAPVVNVTPASVSGIVGEREIKDLPLNGRSFDNLITLNPGTINYSAMKSANTSTSNGNTFSVAGRRTGENLFLLNGVEYMGSSQLAVTPGGASGYLLGIDAVREFNVLTDTYSAEYGKRAGAQVSIVTQSGTNSLHGTVFEFVRNSVFDSPGPFDQGTVPPLKRNQFGAALGGPLKKDRLFLFGNYEGFRESLAVSSLSVVPDATRTHGHAAKCEHWRTDSDRARRPLQHVPYMSFWPQPDLGPELMVPSTDLARNAWFRAAFRIRTTIPTSIFGKISAPFAPTTISVIATLLPALIRSTMGTSLIPLADPLFASYTPLRMQVFSLAGNACLFAPNSQYATVGFSRASFGLDSVLPWAQARFLLMPCPLSPEQGPAGSSWAAEPQPPPAGQSLPPARTMPRAS